MASILSNQEQGITITAFCSLNNVSEVPVSTKVGQMKRSVTGEITIKNLQWIIVIIIS